MTEKYVKLHTADSVARSEISTHRDGVYYAYVTARGKDANHRLTLRITDGERVIRSYAYFVSTQPTEVYLPFIATGEERFVEAAALDGGEFDITDLRAESSPYEYNKTKTGTYLAEDDLWYTETVLSSDTDGLLNTRNRVNDCIIVGDYMYALSLSRMYILKRSGGSFEKIGETAPLGELRQMSLTSDKRGIIVTARNFGLYSFDISDPEHPRVASHIDSLEMATGLDIFGNYLYVADRTFGVDIIDISDIYSPVFISNIPTGETQDVCYNNGYAYAGVWAECKVRICDVRDPDAPREVAAIELSGRGDGVFVKDGILYAATGQFALGESKDRYNAGYGLGNGLEIWDVHDPLSPKRLSVIRADGASYPGNPDLWRVYTSGKYLLFTSVYCGAYIYDVSDKTAPVRVGKYQVLSADQKNDRWSESYVFPHQSGCRLEDNMKPYPIVDTCIDGDKLYICTGEWSLGNNLYEVRLPFFIGFPDENDSGSDRQLSGYDRSYFASDCSDKLFDAVKYVTSSQIRSAALSGDHLYLAAGTRGIVILDKHSMREVASVPSYDITKDVKVKDGYLYSAESTAGIAVYKIDENDPTVLIPVSQKPLANIVQLELSPDARYAVAHISNVAGLIDLRDKSEPSLYYLNSDFHMVYQYQISVGCIGDRYLAVSATKGKIQIYDFGEGGSLEEPRIDLIFDTTPITGMCADGDRLFISSGSSTYRIDPSELSSERAISERDDRVRLSGMLGLPVIIGEHAFTARRSSGAYNILKLSGDRSQASVCKSIVFRGNPGMTVSDGERYYLPLAYGGIISFKLPD